VPPPVELQGERVRIRPAREGDGEVLYAMLDEPAVARWWGPPESLDEFRKELSGETDEVWMVVEVDGQVAGGIGYYEETEPNYRHAGIDIFLATRFQDAGAGTEAVGLLARHLVAGRGHHRLIIDPAADNARAIRTYSKVGFKPVGVMRRYERGLDGTFHDGLLMDLLAEELA